MKVKVTDNDIRDDEPLECARCPIALAVRRAMRRKVEAGIAGIYKSINAREPFMKWPQSVASKIEKFINDFDSGKSVKPFTFELKLK